MKVGDAIPDVNVAQPDGSIVPAFVNSRGRHCLIFLRHLA